MKKRRAMAVVMVSVMGLQLAACGTNSGGQSSDTGSSKAADASSEASTDATEESAEAVTEE